MSPAWVRGDVVAITSPAHPGAVAVNAAPKDAAPWFLVDETCAAWRSTEWVNQHAPKLIARNGTRHD